MSISHMSMWTIHIFKCTTTRTSGYCTGQHRCRGQILCVHSAHSPWVPTSCTALCQEQGQSWVYSWKYVCWKPPPLSAGLCRWQVFGVSTRSVLPTGPWVSTPQHFTYTHKHTGLHLAHTDCLGDCLSGDRATHEGLSPRNEAETNRKKA